MNDPGVPAGAEFAYEVGVRTLESQSRRVDSLDTKAAVVLAVDGVLAGLLFQGGGVIERAPQPLGAVAILLLLGSFLTGLRAFWTRKYATAPHFAAVMAWMIRDESWLKWRFLGNIQEAESENSRKLQRKVRWLSCAVGLLFVDVCVLGGYLLWITVR